MESPRPQQRRSEGGGGGESGGGGGGGGVGGARCGVGVGSLKEKKIFLEPPCNNCC